MKKRNIFRKRLENLEIRKHKEINKRNRYNISQYFGISGAITQTELLNEDLWYSSYQKLFPRY